MGDTGNEAVDAVAKALPKGTWAFRAEDIGDTQRPGRTVTFGPVPNAGDALPVCKPTEHQRRVSAK